MANFAILMTQLLLITILTSVTCSTSLQRYKWCLQIFGVKPEGKLIQRGNNEMYKNLNGDQWFIGNGTIYPAAHLLPRHAKDLQAAVICARWCKIRIVPKSGGHGVTKYAYGDFNSIVIDLRRLNTVSMEQSNQIGLIGPGTKMAQFAHGLWSQGKFMIPHGACHTIGIAGFALGGGAGYFARHFGPTSDNIAEMEFVDATGKLLTINSNKHPELFWALRGAGGSGSFGIVTCFLFKVHKAPVRIVFAELQCNNLSSFPGLFSIWTSFFNSNPPGSINSIMFLRYNSIILHLIDAQDVQSSEAFGDNRMRSILSRFPKPATVSIESMDYPKFAIKTANLDGNIPPNVTTLSELASIKWNPEPTYLKMNSFYIQRPFNESDILGFSQLLGKYLNMPGLSVELMPLGGAWHQLSPTDTAFVHRGPHTKFAVETHGMSSNQSWVGFKKLSDISSKLASQFFIIKNLIKII